MEVVYDWRDTKFRFWDSRTQEWVTYKEDTTNYVSVDVMKVPESFIVSGIGSLSGTTRWWEEVVREHSAHECPMHMGEFCPGWEDPEYCAYTDEGGTCGHLCYRTWETTE